MRQASNQDQKSVLRRVPWLGVLGLLVSVAGIVVTAIFDLGSQKQRALVYAVNPVRTTVVAAGQVSQLEVLHNGKRLGNANVVAAQIAIWNAGKESIRRENILQDIVISTTPSVQILEASIKVRSREVTEFTLLDTAETLAEGKTSVSWRILEQNDGASIQLIYSGPENVDIAVGGIIEGLPAIRQLEGGVKIKTPYQQVSEYGNSRVMMLVIIGGWTITGVAFWFATPSFRRAGGRGYGVAFMTAMALAGIGTGVWVWLSTGNVVRPPFGF